MRWRLIVACMLVVVMTLLTVNYTSRHDEYMRPFQAAAPPAVSVSMPSSQGITRQRSLEEDVADARQRLRVRASGGEGDDQWALICHSTSTPRYGNALPSLPRCYLHKKKCAADFKVYVYKEETEVPSGQSGKFFKAVHASFLSVNKEYVTADPLHACLFFLGIDTVMFGNARGMLPSSFEEGNKLLADHHPHAAPPFSSWVPGGVNVSLGADERPLWGTNHVALGFSDWCIDEERSFTNQGMLPVRSSTVDITYQPWIDLNIPLPKVVANQETAIVPSSERGNLLFFSGSSYCFQSSRYQLRLLRDLGSDVRVWVYCYDKTKKKRSAAKWVKMKQRCKFETDRAVADGFMPGFKKRGGAMIPPEQYNDTTADVYTQEMGNATFCPIVRGWGFHSYRLTEALYFGCIPVIFDPGPMSSKRGDETYLIPGVAKSVPPMNETIMWESVALFASEDLLYTEEARREFIDKLRALKSNSTLINDMQRRGKLVHDTILGGADVTQSMAVMTKQIIETYKYRAKVFDQLLPKN
eukprot:TRINITY_DN6011_c1_g4_i1.p2 TRINITY_DN6011_c1_g4~~TRINITY_DN6011_c1_g4_i1.p2  ORF type:complete len:527 (+),score=146.37 TRINITY_DN6011_c1_g4_i1:1043-2623(+)